MPRLNDYDVTDYIAGLIYGPAGSGKTTLFGTLGSRNLIIDTGHGMLTLKSKDFRALHPGVNPIIERIWEGILPDISKPDDYAHNRICDILDEYLDPKHPMFNEFDAVCIDDATGLKQNAANFALEINSGLGKSNSLQTSKKWGQKVQAIQDYGQEIDIIDKFLTDYILLCKDRGKHFFIAAHERLTYKKEKPSDPPLLVKTRPGFTGQTFPDNVQGHFDFVWHTESQGGGDRKFYYAVTSGDSALDAKTRGGTGVFPVRWQNPNLLEAIKRFKEQR